MIRVLLVDDVELMRSALIALLERVADIEVVAKMGTSPSAMSMAAASSADVVIINSDSVATQELPPVAERLAIGGSCAVLILTDPRMPVTLRPGWCAPAPSLLDKDVSAGVLVEAVRRLAAGERVIDQRLALAALTGGESLPTTRELEVLRLAADGASVGEIAHRLYLSVGTVRNYLSKVIGRTGARNRIDAIRIAREAGWLTDGPEWNPTSWRRTASTGEGTRRTHRNDEARTVPVSVPGEDVRPRGPRSARSTAGSAAALALGRSFRTVRC